MHQASAGHAQACAAWQAGARFVRRQNISDRKGLDLRDYLAHRVSFKPPCSDAGVDKLTVIDGFDRHK